MSKLPSTPIVRGERFLYEEPSHSHILALTIPSILSPPFIYLSSNLQSISNLSHPSRVLPHSGLYAITPRSNRAAPPLHIRHLPLPIPSTSPPLKLYSTLTRDHLAYSKCEHKPTYETYCPQLTVPFPIVISTQPRPFFPPDVKTYCNLARTRS